MFTDNNTDGFTKAELEILNEALAIRVERGEDEQDASDTINDLWQPDATVEELV